MEKQIWELHAKEDELKQEVGAQEGLQQDIQNPNFQDKLSRLCQQLPKFEIHKVDGKKITIWL